MANSMIAMVNSWPWVGRRPELAAARRALAPSRGRFVVITGGEAVGKTRLAREIAADRTAVRWSSACSAGRGLPTGALARWVDPTDLPSDQVRALARDTGLLVVDDVDLLDDASLAVVAEAAIGGLVPVILTYTRYAALSPESADLVTHPRAERIALHDFDQTESGRVIEAALGGPVDAGTAARFWHASDGTPGYLRALVQHACDTGALTERFGIWTLDGDPEIPAVVAERIGARIAQAGPAAAEVLDCLLEAGDLPGDVLAGMTADGALAAASAAGLIRAVRVSDDGLAAPAVSIAHPMIAAVRRASSGIAHRRRLRALLAARLREVQLDHRNLSLELGLASLALDQPGFTGRDRLLVRGADAAVRGLDFALAIRFARAVGPGPVRSAALLTEGYIASVTGSGDLADELLARACAARTEPALTRTATLLRVLNQVTARAAPDEAQRILDDAAGTLGAATAAAARGFLLATRGRAVEACALLRSHSAPTGAGNLPELARTFRTTGLVIGAGDAGLPHLLDEAIRAGDADGDRWRRAPHQRISLACLDIHARHLCGDIAGAVRAGAQIVELVPDLAGPGRHWLSGLAGVTAFAEAAMTRAVAILRTALDGLDRCGAPDYVRYLFWLDCAEAAAQSGDLATADEMAAHLGSAPGALFAYARPRVDLVHAWLDAARGLTADAAARARGTAAHARERGQPAAEVYCLQAAVRFGDDGCAERLTALAADLPQCPRAVLAAAHARALAAADPEALTRAAAGYLAAGMAGEAADTDAQAALLLRTTGRSGAALSATQRAVAAAQARGLTSVAVETVRAGDRLTPRQREIMRLAAAGLSNRQIASATGLSVRTVEGHRYRAAQLSP